MQKTRARISGTGSYTPPNRMTNEDLERIVDTSDEWIITRTGIKERRITDDSVHSSDMAVAAARQALDMSGRSPEDIRTFIVATVTPDYRLPSTACIAQEKLGLKNAAAFDVVAACTGFINGLSIGRSMIESGSTEPVLVVGTEKLTSIANYEDRTTCVLFGDAAGAAVLEPSDNGSGLLSTYLRSDGGMAKWLWIERGGSVNPYTDDFAFDGTDKIQMNGSDVFKVAVREMASASRTVLADAGLTADDVSLVIPHQANIRIIEAIAKRLKIGMDRFYVNIDKFGNTSSASIPLALDQANRAGLIKEGDLILMAAFGGGLIWGSALIRW